VYIIYLYRLYRNNKLNRCAMSRRVRAGEGVSVGEVVGVGVAVLMSVCMCCVYYL
jgi:hypothetical protein